MTRESASISDVNQAISCMSETGRKECDKCGLGADKPEPNVKFLYCGGCRGFCYCSKECQKADWDDHRLICPAKKPSKSTDAQSKSKKKGNGSGTKGKK